MYRSNQSFNIPPPPPGIPRAFDTFAVPGRREFDHQSLPGGGEFERSLDFMWNLWLLRTWRASDHGGLVRRFQRERLSLCGELVAKKGIKQTLCSFWRYLNFDICNIGFRLWIYEGIKLCLQWNTIPNYVGDSIQYNNKKLNRGQLLWPAAFMFINKVSDDACLWNGHKYRIYGM